MSNFKIWSIFSGPWTPKYIPKVSSDLFYGEIYLTKLKVFTFLRWNLYGRYPYDVKFQNSEWFFWLLDPNIVTKSAIRFVLRWNLLKKTQGLTFLSRNLYGRYSKDVKFQNCMHLFWFLDPKIVNDCITFVLRWNLLQKTFISPFWDEICLEVP
jgi:hypothetical protein